MVRNSSLFILLLLISSASSLDEVDLERDSKGDMTEWQREHWNDSIKNLRRYCPTRQEVIVLFDDLKPREFGVTSLIRGENVFTVRIDPKTAYFTKVNTLIHEWAHCISWTDNTHGDGWGKAYAKCYRTVMLKEKPYAQKKEVRLSKP